MIKYIKDLVHRKKETTEYQEMTEPEKILQAIEDVVGKFCLPVCESCGQDQLEHRLKKDGGVVCKFCAATYYMMMDSRRNWKLIKY
jgi:formylmethanofuran dehydrogenase subunit E